MSEPELVPAEPTEIWARIESFAASYEQTHGVRPNRLRIGAEVARVIEPDSTHPPHTALWSPTPGVWFPDQPPRPTFVRSWRCWKREGGHWWHPMHGTMIDWFCCACGRITDGLPRDGTSGW